MGHGSRSGRDALACTGDSGFPGRRPARLLPSLVGLLLGQGGFEIHVGFEPEEEGLGEG